MDGRRRPGDVEDGHVVRSMRDSEEFVVRGKLDRPDDEEEFILEPSAATAGAGRIAVAVLMTLFGQSQCHRRDVEVLREVISVCSVGRRRGCFLAWLILQILSLLRGGEEQYCVHLCAVDCEECVVVREADRSRVEFLEDLRQVPEFLQLQRVLACIPAAATSICSVIIAIVVVVDAPRFDAFVVDRCEEHVAAVRNTRAMQMLRRGPLQPRRERTRLLLASATTAATTATSSRAGITSS